VRHETYERLVALLLGFGSGYGYAADDSLMLFGYGPPLQLPVSPVDLAELLYDPGTCGADASGPRIASALALSNTGGTLAVATPAFGGTVLDGAGGAGSAGIAGGGGAGGAGGFLGALGADTDTFNMGVAGGAGGGGGARGAPPPGGGGGPAPPGGEPKEGGRGGGEGGGGGGGGRVGLWGVRRGVARPGALCLPCRLAWVSPPLAADLFNAAFVAVWSELYDDNQDSLIQALEAAFGSETIPTSILQSLLNLAEFMEHDEKALPIDVPVLGALAERVGAYAKALHHKETEFHSSPTGCIEALISINNQLDQPEAAVGILKFAQQQAHGYGQYGYRASHMTGAALGAFASDVTGGGGGGAAAGGGAAGGAGGDGGSLLGFGVGLDVQEGWYEKLGRWEDALEAYERKQVENPNSLSLVLGRMRCLKALGEWQRLDSLSRDAWPRLAGNDVGLRAVAPLAARAAWALGRWDDMEEYISRTDELTSQGAFFRAVLAVHRMSFTAAGRFIDRARRVLAAEFAAMGNETFARAYRKMVTVQQLAEMEEILTYLRLQAAGNVPGARTYITHVRAMWEARLRGCAKNVDVWNRVLSVRSLATVASENMSEWLQFASLCRRSGRMSMALKVLMGLGMDGGGGMTEAMSRYLAGQGTIFGGGRRCWRRWRWRRGCGGGCWWSRRGAAGRPTAANDGRDAGRRARRPLKPHAAGGAPVPAVRVRLPRQPACHAGGDDACGRALRRAPARRVRVPEAPVVQRAPRGRHRAAGAAHALAGRPRAAPRAH